MRSPERDSPALQDYVGTYTDAAGRSLEVVAAGAQTFNSLIHFAECTQHQDRRADPACAQRAYDGEPVHRLPGRLDERARLAGALPASSAR